MSSGVTLVAALEVFLFGVVWTQGVYGSRLAWLAGVVLPLVAITAGLAFAGARLGGSATDLGLPRRHRDPRRAPRTIGVVSLVLIGIPVALAALLWIGNGLLVVGNWFH